MVQFFPIGISRRRWSARSDHVGSVPLQARRTAAQRKRRRSSPRATDGERRRATPHRAISRPTRSSRSRGRPRLAARRRVSRSSACAAAELARLRSGDRPARRQGHRSHARCRSRSRRWRTSWAASRSMRAWKRKFRAAGCGEAIGGAWREPPLRQRDHGGAGVRPPRRAAVPRRAQREMRVQPFRREAAVAALDLAAAGPRADGATSDEPNSAEMLATLQDIMADDVGPFRTGAKLTRAIGPIDDLAAAARRSPVRDGKPFDMRRIDWFDLRNMTADRARGRGGSASAHRKPRRAPARRLPRHAAGMAAQPGGALADGELALSATASAAEVAAQ